MFVQLSTSNASGQFLYEYNIHIQQIKCDNKVDDGDHLCSILAKEATEVNYIIDASRNNLLFILGFSFTKRSKFYN